MPLTTGTRLGPYEIAAAIGAGGMGEVYRARDTKLGRDVALKVLPETFARDAERMARFRREAKVLASLNHPNIATIHGFEDSGSIHALVMELVEGPTLADRIKSGTIPIEEALPIAKQICEALEYAHERGIVHRDLKPSNIKIGGNDAVKILDFGLAKALECDAATTDISNSPTLSHIASRAGFLLGTAAYMSPEQAKGKSADRRADIWAFGCVLYEMLAGKMAFSGETITDTLAAVIRAEPHWDALPASTPQRIRELLRRCLQKDPRQRLQAIGEARIVIEEVVSGASQDSSVPSEPGLSAKWSRALPWAVAAALGIVAALFALGYFTRAPQPAAPLQASLLPPKGYQFAVGNMALSPDGTKIAFVVHSPTDHSNRVWIRALGSTSVQPLAGTEGANMPFWSPDSKSVAFFADDNKLKRADASGGPVIILADAAAPRGGTWGKNGQIVFAPELGGKGLAEISSDGGTVTWITHLDSSSGQNSHRWPSFLPDGRHLLFFAFANPGAEKKPGANETGIYILDLKTGEQSLLMQTSSLARYADGYLLYVADGNLMGRPLDPSSPKFSGEAVPLAQGVAYNAHFGVGAFTASTNGLLAYVGEGAGPSALQWFTREGKETGQVGAPGQYSTVAISPDGKRVATSIGEPGGPKSDIWIYGLARGTAARLATEGRQADFPVWSTDSSTIFYCDSGSKGAGIYSISDNSLGGPQFVGSVPDQIAANSVWPDGSLLLYMKFVTGLPLLWIHPMQPEQKDYSLPLSKSESGEGQFSPDGHWLAYVSDDSGHQEIYVVPFSSLSNRWQVSISGGSQPRWRGDGREIYYIAPDGNLMAAPIDVSHGAFKAGIPKALFLTRIVAVAYDYFQFDVTKDGQKFLINSKMTESTQPITIYSNWEAALKKK
jgi:serine/threonine protein kinase